MVLLNFLIPLLYLSFFLGELPKIRLFESALVGPLDLLIFALFAFWSLKIKKSKSYLLEKPIVIFIAVAAFSLLINLHNYSQEQLFVSFLHLFRWGMYASIYFVARDIGKQYEEKLFTFSTITGGLLITVGFLQLIFFPNLISMYHLGWDKHLNRMFSTFLDPNFAGIIFVLLFIFFFHFKSKIFKNNNKFAFTALSLMFASIILTYSRGALLMFASSALVYSLVSKNKKFFLATIISFIAVFIILIPGFYLENTNLLRTNSTLERIGTSVKALQIFKDHPLGVGFNTYRYAREKYGEIDYMLAGPSHSGAGVDNSFIFVLVTTGVLGLVSYLFLLAKMFSIGLAKLNNGYGFVLVVSLAGLIVNSLTINSLFYSFVMLWVWILAGLTESN